MKRTSLFKAFLCSVSGFLDAARHERSMHFHLLATVLVVALGIWTDLEKWDWVSTAICCAAGAVLASAVGAAIVGMIIFIPKLVF